MIPDELDRYHTVGKKYCLTGHLHRSADSARPGVRYTYKINSTNVHVDIPEGNH